MTGIKHARINVYIEPKKNIIHTGWHILSSQLLNGAAQKMNSVV